MPSTTHTCPCPDESHPTERYPSFGAVLTRLLAHRRTNTSDLSAVFGIPEADLASVVSGLSPRAWHLDALAPALGIHTADLYVIEDVPVPCAIGRNHGISNLEGNFEALLELARQHL